MSAATALALPDVGAVRLSIDHDAPVLSISRSDANGMVQVRTLAELLPTAAAGSLVLEDYEAAAGPVAYTITTTAGTVSAATTLALDALWLGVPVTPQFSLQVEAMTGYSADVDNRASIIEPPGRQAPIVITRAGTSRRGSMDLWAANYASALDMLRLVQRGQVILLRQGDHPGMDMYFSALTAALTTKEADRSQTVFGVSVSYVEVARPLAPLSGALGWTWLELNNTVATWADVYAGYATWGDVQTNKRKQTP